MKKFKNSILLINPLYWPAWFALGLLWVIAHLPLKLSHKVGAGLGYLLYLLPTQLKHITQVNIKLCYPELDDSARARLVRKNFASLGIGLIESAMAWWLSDKKLSHLYQLHGLENYEKAAKNGKGILLIAPHATCIEMIGRLLGMHYTFGVMYQPHKNRFIRFIHERFREKHYVTYIPRHAMRELLRSLQSNMPIWYAYDVDGGRKRSLFAPFFGIQTASLTAVSRLVDLSGATIVPISYYRRDNEFFYDVYLHEPVDHFPSEDPHADLTKLNAILEGSIRKKPEQYVWQYKRFKTRPEGEKRFY